MTIKLSEIIEKAYLLNNARLGIGRLKTWASTDAVSIVEASIKEKETWFATNNIELDKIDIEDILDGIDDDDEEIEEIEEANDADETFEIDDLGDDENDVKKTLKEGRGK